MRNSRLWGALLCICALVFLPSSAQAAFGLKDLDVFSAAPDGSPQVQAGSHPYSLTTQIAVNTAFNPESGKVEPEEEAKDVLITFPPGFAGNVTAVPRCSAAEFIAGTRPECPDATAIGLARVEYGFPEEPESNILPVYNLEPSPGKIAKLGFNVEGRAPVVVDVSLEDTYPYRALATTANITEAVFFLSAEVTVWGVPADPAHDEDRGSCLFASKGVSCPVSLPELPYLVLPTSCALPLSFDFEADSWQNPNPPQWFKASATIHDNSIPPNPLSPSGCSKLDFAPRIEAEPTSTGAESATGLDFDLEIPDEGITSGDGINASTIKEAEVTLPEGVTVNPSQAEGLATCSEAQLAKEGPTYVANKGCPSASKIGSAEVQSPLLEGVTLKGGLFVAEPYENRFKSLLAIYMVFRDPQRGIVVSQAGEVKPDPQTGRLITTFNQVPDLPVSHFHLHFREGGRSPLVTPPRCGPYTVEARFTPWTRPTSPYETTASFEIVSGPNGAPCPQGGTPPFNPGMAAGTLNNAAGSFSPFNLRLTRRDGDQDLTKLSADLPPGMVAKLAGTTQCPEASIAAARARTGPHAGAEELASPSCPASSRIGRVLTGAGVGSELTWVPGALHLAGPYNGAPLSVVAVVPAVAGPFDVGVVLTRQALRIDPRSAEVTVDGAASDPIPHILAGIPLKVRDIRAYVDKPQFTLNPTSCDPFAVGAQLWGGGANVFSSADDVPVSLTERFQAADCASLGFKPRLALKLKGGTKRGAHPALTGTYRPRPGDANLSGLVVRLPRSAFLDQAHIRTICTRVQFAAKSCPPGAVYGQAVAHTPLLAEPLSGPVYLRSSDHNLPDFVADLHGLIDVEAVARIDSLRGGIRATFSDIPDAPLTEVTVRMQGAKKGLIINSTDLCRSTHKADAAFSAHNGRRLKAGPVLGARCGKGRKGKDGVARRADRRTGR